jgi:hypothetical protein
MSQLVPPALAFPNPDDFIQSHVFVYICIVESEFIEIEYVEKDVIVEGEDRGVCCAVTVSGLF